jgi:hypothetical protein
VTTAQCSHCGNAVGEHSYLSFHGHFCSDSCSAAASAKRNALHVALLGEPLPEMPEQLSVADFERFALKLALHTIRDDTSVSSSPDPARRILSIPEVMALAIKERIILKLPDGFVISERSRALLGPDYTYDFNRAVPRSLVMKASQEAGVIHWTYPS